MTRRLSPTLAAVVLVGAAASFACSGVTNLSGPSTVTLSDRLGGPWALVAQQPTGQDEATPPAGSTFGFEIVDARAAVTADCNRCNGPASVGDSALTLGPALACTRAYCQSTPFDDVFLGLLAAPSVATLSGDALTLRSERGLLRFQRAPQQRAN